MAYWLKVVIAVVLLLVGIFLYYILKELLNALFTKMHEIRFKSADRSELSSSERHFLDYCESVMGPTGFQYVATIKHSFLESASDWAVQFVFYHPADKCYARMLVDYEHISLPMSPTLEQLVMTAFDTFHSNGFITTHNGMMNLNVSPDEECQWIYEWDVARLYSFHREKVTERLREYSVRELASAAFQADIESRYRLGMEAMESEGLIRPAGDGLWQRVPRAVFRTSKRLSVAEAETRDAGAGDEIADEDLSGKAESAAKLEADTNTDLPPRLLVYLYRRANKYKKLRNNRLGLAPKIIIMVATALYFWLLTGMVFSWTLAPMLIVILLFHELGHLLAMVMFGYKNKGIVFVPIMGAATTGEKERPGFYETLVLYLAGPMPGVIVALILLAVLHPMSASMITFVLVALFVNYVNLFPIPPMDGGRVLQLLSARWHTLVGFLFGALGLVLLVYMMIKWNDYIILIFLIPLGFYVLAQLDILNLHSLMRHMNLSMQKQHESDDLVTILEQAGEDKAYEDKSAFERLSRFDAAYQALKHPRPAGIQWWVGALVYIACLVLPVYVLFSLHNGALLRLFRFWN